MLHLRENLMYNAKKLFRPDGSKAPPPVYTAQGTHPWPGPSLPSAFSKLREHASENIFSPLLKKGSRMRPRLACVAADGRAESSRGTYRHRPLCLRHAYSPYNIRQGGSALRHPAESTGPIGAKPHHKQGGPYVRPDSL